MVGTELELVPDFSEEKCLHEEGISLNHSITKNMVSKILQQVRHNSNEEIGYE
jgi:hypothetical protein